MGRPGMIEVRSATVWNLSASASQVIRYSVVWLEGGGVEGLPLCGSTSHVVSLTTNPASSTSITSILSAEGAIPLSPTPIRMSRNTQYVPTEMAPAASSAVNGGSTLSSASHSTSTSSKCPSITSSAAFSSASTCS